MNSTASMENVCEYLQEKVAGLIAVYLFGSRCKGQAAQGSDYDFAFLSRAPISQEQRLEWALDLGSRLGEDVDLVDLQAGSTVLRVQVIQHGRLLYSSDQRAVEEFEMYTLSDYARLNEEREEIVKSFFAGEG